MRSKGKMRKELLFIIPVFLLFTGCIVVEWTINENGEISSKVHITPKPLSPELLVVTKYRQDIVAFTVFLTCGLAPALIDVGVEMRSDTYDTYILTPHSTTSVEELQWAGYNISFDGHTFEFVIPAMYEEVSEEEKDEVIATFKITFPREIDLANTSHIEGKTATWKLTKEMLTKAMTLKAVLK